MNHEREIEHVRLAIDCNHIDAEGIEYHAATGGGRELFVKATAALVAKVADETLDALRFPREDS